MYDLEMKYEEVYVDVWSYACPMASTEHGRELEEAATVRKMVQQNPARGGQSHRPAGWKRRRPRPRLSHKGPMPF
ncbi:apelin isoform X2 [Sebastes fasciatus]|uniref:apelin isoform X2 n=1 Tax=Sebastes fasciatus TaxID=394691 RepID=UPI003D9F2589